MAARDFATALWDQFNLVSKRSDDAKNYSLEVASFFQKRALIEKEYAQKLQRLIKASHIVDMGTTNDAFGTIQAETEKISKLHSDFADQLVHEVKEKIETHFKDTAKQKKALTDKGQNVIKLLAANTATRDKAKAAYEAAMKKQADTQEEYQKANFSNQPANVVAKLAKKVQKCTKLSVKADEKYKQSLQGMKEAQEKMHETEMPQVLTEMQRLEEGRLQTMHSVFDKFRVCQEALFDQAKETCGTMQQAVEKISVESDIATFIQAHATDIQKPPYVEYEAYDPATGKCGPGGATTPTTMAATATSSATPRVEAASGGSTMRSPNFERGVASLPSAQHHQAYTPSPMGGGSSPSLSPSLSPSSPPLPLSPSPAASGYPQGRALYDYNGETENELTFRAGDILSITNKDPSGWWEGEIDGRVGAFPAEWIEEFTPSSTPPTNNNNIPSSPPPPASSSKCTALFEYTADDEEEVSMNVGDVLSIEYEDSGWYYGTNESTGQNGRFPANYVQTL